MPDPTLPTVTLTTTQIELWKKIYPLIATANQTGARTDLNRLKNAVINLCIDAIEQQPHLDRVVVSNSTLLQFGPNKPFHQKADYIKALRASATKSHKSIEDWFSDDAILAGLETLGFSAKIFIPGTIIPPYDALVQKSPQGNAIDRGLHINIFNVNNAHWRLPTKDNPGRGDCGPYTVAQQLMDSLAFVVNSYPEVAVVKNKWQSFAADHAATAKHEQVVIAQELAAHQSRVAAEIQRETQIAKHLEKYDDLHTLLEIFKYTKDRVNDGDTYLKHSPNYIDSLQEALAGVKLDKAASAELKEDIKHILAMEGWRNKDSFETIMQYQPAAAKNNTVETPKTVIVADETVAHIGMVK